MLLNRWIIPGVLTAGSLGLLLLVTIGGGASAADEPEPTPVLVELFTSQGCLSCPPADELLIQLDAEQPVPGALVITLSEHVEYWNGQWRDPFSSAVFTHRQREYQQTLATRALYTPQMVVDGQAQFIGSRRQLAHDAIARAATRPKATLSLSRIDRSHDGRVSVTVTVSDTASVVAVGSGVSSWQEADLWIAITEDGLETEVERGENAFRRLRHGAVVRTVQQIETFSHPFPDHVSATTAVVIDPEWRTERMRAVVFLQERMSRRVIGATQQEFRDTHSYEDN